MQAFAARARSGEKRCADEEGQAGGTVTGTSEKVRLKAEKVRTYLQQNSLSFGTNAREIFELKRHM
jgi:hypothetical protein